MHSCTPPVYVVEAPNGLVRVIRLEAITHDPGEVDSPPETARILHATVGIKPYVESCEGN
jgi:hypothetical protein